MLIMGKIMKELAKGNNNCDNISLNFNMWKEYLANKYFK